jgi:hypothetical protein
MNKPQCTTSAECLKELARVMEQFGFDDWRVCIKSKYVKFDCAYWNSTFENMPSFDESTYWSFALFELEGKPVFVGSELFHSAYGLIKVTGIGKGAETFAGIATNGITPFSYYMIAYCSWNQPRKTATISINGGEAVEVELVKDIYQEKCGTLVYISCVDSEHAEQLRKALQPLVKEN